MIKADLSGFVVTMHSGLCEQYVHSAGCSRVHAHEPRSRWQKRCYTLTNHQFIVALWHSYTRTILMQYRLVILRMSLLMCDKQHPYFGLLILHNSEHNLSESVWWSVLGVNTLPSPLEGLISISTMTFICKVWCTHNYLPNKVWHSEVAQIEFFSY